MVSTKYFSSVAKERFVDFQKKLPRLRFMLKCYMRTEFMTGLFTVTKFETKVA